MSFSLPIGFLLHGKSYVYKIEKILGQGTFGITYLATTRVKVSGALGEIETELKVAVKEFFMKDINGRCDSTVTCSSSGGLYADYRRKFAREATNLSQLKHPHIVKVLELFEANNTYYYSMEYCEGGTLDALIEKQRGLDVQAALSYFRQIADALSFMHNNHMLHLDLKPSNIMLRGNGEAVLIDFGLSKQYTASGDPESSTRVGLGTPGYAPLEQANYREGKNFPVTMDVYALGATLFKMLTGICPPEASIIFNDSFPVYELRSRNISECTISCIIKAMNPKKKDRFQNIPEFISTLFKGTENLQNNKNNNKSDWSESLNFEKDGVSIFYYNSEVNKIIVCNNGSMFWIGMDEDFLLFEDRRYHINSETIISLENRPHILYDSLLTHIKALGLSEEIIHAGNFVVAYDGRLDYCEVVRYIIRIFGILPKGTRFVKKNHLEAFYWGANSMKYNTGNYIYTSVESQSQTCIIDASEEVVEFFENVSEEKISYNITLNSNFGQELLAGALLLFKNWRSEEHGFVMIDTFPLDIKIGVDEEKQSFFNKRGIPEYSIPCRHKVEIEKRNSDRLYIIIGENSYSYPINSCFKNDDKIEAILDVDANGIPTIEIKSMIHSRIEKITLSNLLMSNDQTSSLHKHTYQDNVTNVDETEIC